MSSSLFDSQGTEVARVVDRVRHEFANSWRQDDNFLEKLFPVCSSWKLQIEATQKRNYNLRTSRWKRIPKAPGTASKLYTPLRVLMNDILLAEEASRPQSSPQRKKNRKSSYRYEEWWHTKHVRGVLATHAKNKRVCTEPRSSVSPTLYLAGGGYEIMGVGTPLIQATSLAGIAPIEVIRDSDSSLAARDRLATNVSQMFCNQSRRRFAFGLVMTENICTAYMFDHSGAVASQPFNYHQRPAQLCAILFRLGGDQCDRLGFDSSVLLEHSRGRILIRTRVCTEEEPEKQVFYIKDGHPFHFSSLIGRGTVCWSARKEGHLGSRYVIKEAWIPCDELSGRESEGSLLRHAQAKGVVDGVARLEHFEEVRRSDDSGDLDTVLRNRQVDKPTAEDMKLERIHTRIVLRSYGKPLDMFDTRKELLLAFHDAVLGAFLSSVCPACY
jgi:Fungal protein kinase